MTNNILEFLLDEKSLTIITGIVMVVVSSIILFICRNGENKKKYLVTFFADCIVLLLALMVYFVCNNYVVVPNIAHLYIAEAKAVLNDCGLKYNHEDFLNNNETVIDCVPGIGEIVKKGSVIYLNTKQPHSTVFESSQNDEENYGGAISSTEEFASEMSQYSNQPSNNGTTNITDNKEPFKQPESYISETTEGQTTKEDIEISEEIYKYDTDYSMTFNTDTIKLYLSDIGVKLNVDDSNFSRTLGQVNISGAKVQLINCETGKVIQQKTSDENGYVELSKIPKGCYILRVEKSGYITQLSEKAFMLNYDPNIEESNLSWSIDLMKNDAVFNKQGFQIKVVDINNNPVIGKEFTVTAIKKGYNQSSFTYLSVCTDENGFISLWHSTQSGNVETDYYDKVTFELSSDYSIDLYAGNNKIKSFDGSEGKDTYIIKV